MSTSPVSRSTEPVKGAALGAVGRRMFAVSTRPAAPEDFRGGFWTHLVGRRRRMTGEGWNARRTENQPLNLA